MRMANRKRDNSDLKSIPGIGKNIEQHLHHIGIETIEDLKGKDPEELYIKDCLFLSLIHIWGKLLVLSNRRK